MSIFVTGGAGYIGSHTCVELLNAGYEIVVMDNLCNSSPRALEAVEEITGKKVKFYEADMLDREAMEEIFRKESIDAVIHFAGLKAVGESVQKPLEYYHNNLTGTLILCDVMRGHGVKDIVFSSSATVYGDPAFVPITEECPKGQITNPYGQTKSMLEQILIDMHVSDPQWNVVLLRYFNPIGAHSSGKIGEDPKGIPNNLVPYIAQVAVGKLEKLGVFGDDYDTPDGTGVRDYIHVVDLAVGHVKAVEKLKKKEGVSIYNLGTGKGYSVLEVLHAYEKACGKTLPYEIKPRRAGECHGVIVLLSFKTTKFQILDDFITAIEQYHLGNHVNVALFRWLREFTLGDHIRKIDKTGFQSFTDNIRIALIGHHTFCRYSFRNTAILRAAALKFLFSCCGWLPIQFNQILPPGSLIEPIVCRFSLRNRDWCCSG